MEKSKEYVRSFPWKTVYSSPMKRCMDTAEYLGISENELHIKDDLREMSAGIWENLTFSEIKKIYPDLYEARGKALGTFAVEGAESFQEAGVRFYHCLTEIIQETDKNILVIAHAGVIRGFLCLLTGINPDQVMDFSIPYGSISVLQEENGKMALLETGLRSEALLDSDEMEAIYYKCQTPTHVISHMKKVAEVGSSLMAECNKKRRVFSEQEIQLVHKAALLHDICRTEKNHAGKSAIFLRKEGYKEIAELVALHHDTKCEEENTLELHELLFYADKLVQEDQIVSIEERFKKSYEKCRGIPEVEEKHRLMYEKTKMIEKKLKRF